MIYAKELNAALKRILQENDKVILMGEDIADPYGGAFKVTRGLSTEFPDRVRTTPVSEGALAGISGGLALAGYRPITEIMFGDFLTLCFDQVVNHLAKYEGMYAGQASCPVILRAPSGGHRGYGPTHSQSLEKHFLGVPGFQVMAASLWHHPYECLQHLLSSNKPALFVEHKLLYPQHLAKNGDFEVEKKNSEGYLPTYCISLVPPEDCTLTVLAYGYEALLAQRVIEKLALKDEIFCELLVPTHLSPIDWAPIEASVARTGRLLTVEEGVAGWSWGTEIAAEIGRRKFGSLERPVEVLASQRQVIPSARDLEASMLVGETQIEQKIREVTR